MIRGKHIRLALAAAVGAVYVWLAHIGSIAEHPPVISLLIGLFPLLAFATVLAWQARHRVIGLGALAGCLALLYAGLDVLRANTAWLYFLQHAGTHALLALTFGRTLFGRQEEALCARIAAIVHDPLPAAVARYTWQVTLAWTVYFVVACIVSVVLFSFGPIEIWSVFANLLTPVLLGSMFVGEYLVRRRILPDEPPMSVAGTIRAYRDYSRRQSASRGGDK